MGWSLYSRAIVRSHTARSSCQIYPDVVMRAVRCLVGGLLGAINAGSSDPLSDRSSSPSEKQSESESPSG
eukprot:scaffold138243_cov75-Attheya_sp.AAC.1